MTTNNITLTQRGKAILEWLKKQGKRADDNRRITDGLGAEWDFFDGFFRMFTLALYVSLLSGLIGMGAAWLLAYPGGVAGFIAGLALASGMGLDAFLPSFAFSVIVLTAFAIYFIQVVANLTSNQEEDDFHTTDDVVAMLIEMDEKISDIDRRTQDDNLVPEVVANMDEKIDVLLSKFE